MEELRDFIRLPIAADGKSIHIGDVMKEGIVNSFSFDKNGWQVCLYSEDRIRFVSPAKLHHRRTLITDDIWLMF